MSPSRVDGEKLVELVLTQLDTSSTASDKTPPRRLRVLQPRRPPPGRHVVRTRVEAEPPAVGSLHPRRDSIRREEQIDHRKVLQDTIAATPGDDAQTLVAIVEPDHVDRHAQHGRRRREPHLLDEHLDERGLLLVVAMRIDGDGGNQSVEIGERGGLASDQQGSLPAGDADPGQVFVNRRVR